MGVWIPIFTDEVTEIRKGKQATPIEEVTQTIRDEASTYTSNPSTKAHFYNMEYSRCIVSICWGNKDDSTCLLPAYHNAPLK